MQTPRIVNVDVATLQHWEGLYVQPATGEAYTVVSGLRPAGPFFGGDTGEAGNRSVVVATGITFETTTQDQTAGGNSAAIPVTPLGHASGETAHWVSELLGPALPSGASVTSIVRRPQDPGNVTPYSLDPWELIIKWNNGKVLHLSAGAFASALIRGITVDPTKDDLVIFPTATTIKWVLEELASKATATGADGENV